MVSITNTLVCYNAQGSLANQAIWQTTDKRAANRLPGAQDLAVAFGNFSLSGTLSAFGAGFYVPTGSASLTQASITTAAAQFVGDITVADSRLALTEIAANETGAPLFVGFRLIYATTLTLLRTTLVTTAASPLRPAAVIGYGTTNATLAVGAGGTLQAVGWVGLAVADPSSGVSSAGTGALSITGGGRVSIDSGGGLGLAIGLDSGGQGNVLVSGAGSSLAVTGNAAAGYRAPGTLVVEGGASASVGGTLAISLNAVTPPFTSSVVQVAGGGMLSAGAMTVGSRGSLSIDGGTVHVGTGGLSVEGGLGLKNGALLDCAGAVTLIGPKAFTAGTLIAGGGLDLREESATGGLHTVTIAGGRVEVTGATHVAYSETLDVRDGSTLSIGGTNAALLVDPQGTATVTGAGAALAFGGSARLSGPLLASDGGALRADTLEVAPMTRYAGALTIGAGGRADIDTLDLRDQLTLAGGDVTVGGRLLFYTQHLPPDPGSDVAAVHGGITGATLGHPESNGTLSALGGALADAEYVDTLLSCAVRFGGGEAVTDGLVVTGLGIYAASSTISVLGNVRIAGAGMSMLLLVAQSEMHIAGGGLTVGEQASGSATLQLGGDTPSQHNEANGTLTLDGTATVGAGGFGVVYLNAGRLDAGAITVGGSGGGAINLSLTGNTLTAGMLALGAGGDGALSVSGTANTVSVGQLTLGTGGAGTASIGGLSSTLTVTDAAAVGVSTAGTLSLSFGATATISAGAGPLLPALMVGAFAGGAGSAIALDTGARLTVNGLAAIGLQGAGTATISGGASLSAGGIVVGYAAAGLSTLQVARGGSVSTGSLTVGNAGSAGRLLLGAQGTVTVAGNTMVGGAVQLSSGRLSGTGTLTVAQGATVSGLGRIREGAIVDLGRITAGRGVLRCAGPVSGTGTLAAMGGANLVLTRETRSIHNDFGPGGGTFTAASAASLPGMFLHWVTGDVIHLTGALYTGKSFVDGTLTLTGAGGGGTLSFAGAHKAGDFVLSSDGHGGTVISHG